MQLNDGWIEVPSEEAGWIDVPSAPADEGQSVAGEPSVLADVATSGATGLAKGIINLAGLPGDVQELMRAGLKAAGVNIPDNMPLPNIALAGMSVPAATSQQIQQGVESVTGALPQPQTTAGEFAETIGEFAPAAVGGGAGVVRKAAQVALPAVGSELAGQATKGTSAEPFARVAGAVAGGVAPAAAAKAISPLTIPMERKAALNVLKKEGVDVTAGQASGNKTVQFAESEIGGGAAANAMSKQQEQFTRAVLKRIGVNSNRATPEVIDDATTQIGNKFNSLAKGNNVKVDNKLTKEMTDIADEYANLGGVAPVVLKTASEIARKGARGPISGEVYQAFSSRLARQARSTSDPDLKNALLDLRSSLDGAFERTLSAQGKTDVLQQLKEARRQYRDLLVVEKAVTGAGEDTALGVISPLRLRAAITSQSRREFARGKRDLGELARAGTAIMSPLPQSGTAPRAAARAIPTLIGGALGAAGTGGDIMSTVASAAAGPMLGGRVLMSSPVQGVLKNQALSGVSARPGLARAPLNAALAR